MPEFIVTGMMLVLIISPFIFLYLKDKKLALINGILVFFYLITWFSVLSNNVLREMNFGVIIWSVLLLLNCVSIIISFSKLMKKWFTTSNATFTLLASLSVVISILPFLFINPSSNMFLDLTDFVYLYFLPMYLLLGIVIGLVKLDRKQLEKH